jgi:phage terminase Nu1 subunit (DNA packaging protein)
MLAVPSRVAARLPHLSKHDVAEIDAEIRVALAELGEDGADA